jgi:WD40 repeat protein
MGKISLINVRTRKVIREFSAVFSPEHAPGDWYVLAFSRLGDRLVIGHNGRGGIVIHDTQTGGKEAEWDAEPSQHLEVSDDGKYVLQRALGGEESRHLNMLDANTGKVLWTVGKTKVDSDVHAVNAGIFLSDSKRVLLTRDWEANLPILDSSNGQMLSEIKLNPSFSWITCFAVDPRAEMVVAGNTVGEILGVDVHAGIPKYRFRTGYGYIKLVSITPDGKRFITVSEAGDGRNPIQIWDLATGKLLESLFGSSGGIAEVSAHPISGELVVTSNNHEQTRLWATTTAPESWSLYRNGSVCPPTFWNSENRIFCGWEDRATVLYDLSAKQPIWSAPSMPYDQVRVSADGALVEVMPPSGRVKVLPRILLRAKPDGTPETVGEFTFDGEYRMEQLSPDGHWLLMGRDRSFGIFDTLTRVRQGTIGEPDITIFRQHAWVPGTNHVLSLATANGSRGTANSIEEILLQEAPSGKRLKAVTYPTAMNTLAVSKDGHLFAEAGVDRHIRIRDSETLEIKIAFRAHDAPIRSLAFHPNGRLIASSSEDFTIKIWEVATGRLVEELRGFRFAPANLAFSPSGRRLAAIAWEQAGSFTGTQIWELPSLAEESGPAR